MFSIVEEDKREFVEVAMEVTKFLKEVRQEMEKVVWPTRKELARLTAVVIGLAILVSIYITILDYSFNGLIRFLVGGF